MRELERSPDTTPPPDPSALARVAVVGDGRAGRLLASALRESGLEVLGPLGRGATPRGTDAVLLCVPDGQIAAAAALVPAGPPVGHCSGATSLDALRSHRDAFSLHPLMTIAGGAGPELLRGAGAAIAGATPRGLAVAGELARRLGLRAVEVGEDDRAAYHAAASVASNFLVTLEGAAERLLEATGVSRELLVPLVRATVENWAQLGAAGALTGPVARGDEATVERQREAVAHRAPELLELFDALAAATRSLAGHDRVTA